MNNYKFDYYLKTLTPVSVGSGGLLSPLTDYVKDDNYFYIIDQKLFEQKLSEKPAEINYLMDAIKRNMNSSNTSSGFILGDYIINRLKLNLSDVSYVKTPITSSQKKLLKSDKYKLHIKQCVKNAGKPYVPGSTLKGAFITALLYDHLKNKPALLDALLVEIKSAINDPNPKSAKRNIAKIADNFVNKILTIDKLKLSSGLKISDTNYIDIEDSLLVVLSERYNMFFNKSQVPLLLEAVHNSQNSESDCFEFNGSITLNGKFEESLFSVLNDGNISALVRILNNYASDLIEMEIKTISEIDEMDEDVKETYLETLESILTRTKSDKRAIVRIGAGKGFYFNTVSALIHKRDPKLFENMLKVLFDKYKKGHFPKTRQLIINDNVPLGWCRIDFE
jgi:CRISPR-associated protein Csm5